MNPFYFGTSAYPLYGVHHPPSGAATGIAVVLCYPMGGEYLRAHRAFRQLTNLLVRSGAHVLRFDYLGTGDSGGDPSDASIPRWLEDIDAAILELKESTGFGRVSLAGLRMGATLAATAGFGREDIARIVLWDPIAHGGAWIDGVIPEAIRGGAGNPVDTDIPFPPGTVGVEGFPLTPTLAGEVRALDLAGIQPAGGAIIEVLVPREDVALRALVERWNAADQAGTGRATYRCIPSEGDWAVGDRFGSALIPQAIIQGVVQCLTEA